MPDYSLTELQLEIMKVVWERGEATVVEVQEALVPERRLAHSTVATLLSRLEKRGLLEHRTRRRQYVYRAVVSEQVVRDAVVREFTELADELFRGDVAALVSQLLTARDVEPEDLARVKEMIAAKERELRRRDR